MRRVEIFKTSVRTFRDAEKLVNFLLLRFPHYKVNFDLDDCDRILRIETTQNDIDKNQISNLLKNHGYDCFSL